MNVAGGFVDSGSRATIPIGDEVELEFGKQPEVFARVEIEMGHHPVHDVSIVVLRRSAKHPVVEVLVFDAVFESQREVLLGVFT